MKIKTLEHAAEIVDWCDALNEMSLEGKTEEEMLASLTYMEAPQWVLNSRWIRLALKLKSNRVGKLIRITK